MSLSLEEELEQRERYFEELQISTQKSIQLLEHYKEKLNSMSTETKHICKLVDDYYRSNRGLANNIEIHIEFMYNIDKIIKQCLFNKKVEDIINE
jgi:hypothetical protein